jgi:hypothetical protein
MDIRDADEEAIMATCASDRLRPRWDGKGASMAWANFHKIVFYGISEWPSYSYWIVPGTITDEERM